MQYTARIVSLNDHGLPDAEGPLAVGDRYLTLSATEPEQYDQWLWAGETLGWQRLETLAVFDEEKALREQRVKRVKQYFRENQLKRQRRDELIASRERGEHLSREELRELSAMGYTV